MKFKVFNRWTGDLQFTADIDCAESEYTSVKVGLAVKWAYKTGASLDGARLDGARLDGARLVGARLVGASLVGASLVGASLDGARLDGARLDGASLAQGEWTVQGATRSDGYAFLLTNFTAEGIRIKAGCRNFTIEQANRHWADSHPGTTRAAESFEIINGMYALAFARGFVDKHGHATKPFVAPEKKAA